MNLMQVWNAVYVKVKHTQRSNLRVEQEPGNAYLQHRN